MQLLHIVKDFRWHLMLRRSTNSGPFGSPDPGGRSYVLMIHVMIHLHVSVPGAKLPIRQQSCGSANQRELFEAIR